MQFFPSDHVITAGNFWYPALICSRQELLPYSSQKTYSLLQLAFPFSQGTGSDVLTSMGEGGGGGGGGAGMCYSKCCMPAIHAHLHLPAVDRPRFTQQKG